MCLEASHAQLVLAHLEIARLGTALRETEEHGKKKNTRAKLMSLKGARLLTGDEYHEAIDVDNAAKAAKKLETQRTNQADVTDTSSLSHFDNMSWSTTCTFGVLGVWKNHPMVLITVRRE